MNPSIAAQASQAAAQGQQQLANDRSNAANYQTQYGNYQQQAGAAGQNVADYTKYMQGAGSAGNVYHNELGSQLNQLGYDPAQMTAARSNLNQATGAMSAYSDFANQAASKWGLNAGAFAAANSGALNNLNNNIASNQQVVSGLQNLYQTAQTGANQLTGQTIQGEQNTLAGLQRTFENAANQRDSASTMMNFYDQLAQQQGGLNAQQASNYAAAQQAYASASQALAQAAQINQQVQFMTDARNKFGLAQTMGIQPSAPTPNGGSNQPSASNNTAPADAINQFFSNPHALGQQIESGVGNAIGGLGNTLHSALNWFGSQPMAAKVPASMVGRR